MFCTRRQQAIDRRAFQAGWYLVIRRWRGAGRLSAGACQRFMKRHRAPSVIGASIKPSMAPFSPGIKSSIRSSGCGGASGTSSYPRAGTVKSVRAFSFVGVPSFCQSKPALAWAPTRASASRRRRSISSIPLEKLLPAIVDFDLVNSGKTRFTLGLTTVQTGQMRYFKRTSCLEPAPKPTSCGKRSFIGCGASSANWSICSRRSKRGHRALLRSLPAGAARRPCTWWRSTRSPSKARPTPETMIFRARRYKPAGRRVTPTLAGCWSGGRGMIRSIQRPTLLYEPDAPA